MNAAEELRILAAEAMHLCLLRGVVVLTGEQSPEQTKCVVWYLWENPQHGHPQWKQEKPRGPTPLL
jgi:hypothetical protein